MFRNIAFKICLSAFLIIAGLSVLTEAQSRFTPTEYVVGKIYISGNHSFSTSRLKKQMNLKDKRFNRTKTFTRRLIELDRILLQTIYIKNGYIDCVVSDSFKVQDDGLVDLFYFITEGRQYYLNKIEISGNTSLSESKILDILDHRLEKPYNPIRIREGIKQLRTEYANNGKPLASVTDSLEVNDGIHLFIRVAENPTMRIGDVKIVNNKLVREKPIRREILLNSGDLYSQKRLNLSKKHIFETGLFSSVNIRLADIDTAQHTLNLIVDVRELDMRYLGLKFGFGQDRGISSGSEPYTSFAMDSEWLNRNIAGRGSRLSTKLGFSLNLTNILMRPKTEAEILFIEPWLLGFRSSTSFRLFLNNQLLKDEEMTSYGGEIALTYQPDRRFMVRTGTEMKKIFYRNITTGTKRDTSTSANERAFTLNIRRDYRDNFLFPTEGTVFTFTGKIVGTILGGTQDYYWFETSFSQYLPIIGRIVFAYRGKFGYQKSLGKKDTPLYAKFYLGGGSSLRGWEYDEFVAGGGNVKVLTNAEIRFPLLWLLGGEI
ncbi:BamA/TamA family outer membrane protein, partial [bacterium]|nr:BamA/TamA family outer membrane protein [bacterium]